MTLAELEALGVVVNNTVGGTTLDRSFSAANETINDSGNDDTIIAGTGNDLINADQAAKTIELGSGDSTVNSTGSDTWIYGGSGSSIIEVNEGSGTQELWENTTKATGQSDTIAFGTGLDKSDLELTSSGTNLTLTLGDESIELVGALDDGAAVNDFTFADGTNWTLAQLLSNNTTVVDSTTNSTTLDRSFSEADETINASGTGDYITLGSGTNTLNASGASDTVTATSGNDTINITNNDATVNLGSGTELVNNTGSGSVIDGGSGNDTFTLNTGSGSETIEESVTKLGGASDTLDFGTGVTQSDVSATASGNNLTLNVDGASATLDAELNDDATINTFKFANGTTLTLDQVLSDIGMTVNSTVNDDHIDESALSAMETINASGINDTITTSSGPNTVNMSGEDDLVNLGSGTNTVNGTADDQYFYGSTGTDTINASGNDDYIHAGSGATTITASGSGAEIWNGAGSDTYIENTGTGTQTINESTTKTSGASDTVQIGSSIADDIVALFMSGSTLEIGYVGNSTDQINVTNQTTTADQIGKIQLADGNYLDTADINNIIQEMSTYATDNSVSFSSLSDVKADSGLMNIIANSWHT